ncbi:PREDICTED: BAG family molecular chaperone regulator 5, mitochondrial [Nelumbo nucifera]|uniref:BAG family molecular chaperone regulator 5, mitochondrial n=2 Tax=Nelumbo nucifera TaxID=4432 RepID=A0A1U7ZFX0_NELNU|nr:PREDICTED: BAG family molecular chaperone regulator 5, mitochondrial [Nelumbo nucifera]XP_010252623.1 PREDICTED: BAG family molecular chaperone regulator 5, mitochondrial [Nelumbo nucifera]DAD23537.1 TPA_asm: hypothetical protein HUJ06_025000 [Nelumbo nucifera]
MKASLKARFSYTTTTTTVTNISRNDQNAPPSDPKIVEIPIESPSETPLPVTDHLPSTSPPQTQAPPDDPEFAAAVKIQSTYRAYVVRALVSKISAINSEANRLERLIQRQETVDAIRSGDREKLRMNEALMSLLLQLDSVPGVNPTVRELRRSVSRRVVVLQEILDAVADARVDDGDGFLRNWDEVIAHMEEDACKERGGEELERFCVEKLGFRCMQRFLRGI